MTGYQRVSRKSPCSICGKPDWCSRTKDHNIAFCARSAAHADRISSKGWGIFYYDRQRPLREDYTRPRRKNRHPESTPVSPVEIRDKIYSRLIQLSPFVANGHQIYQNERLFRHWDDSGRYRIFPQLATERDRLVQLLIELSRKNEGTIPTFQGVPGFWHGSTGRIRLGSKFDYNADLLLIPFIDMNGLIQACQMKVIGKTKNRSAKYQWLSSIGKSQGSGPGTPLHHEGSIGFRGKTSEAILVTEGVIKAAIAQRFLPDRYVVANSGVATSHREIVTAARHKDLEIAFDADCFTNPHVARSTAALIALRMREQRFLFCDKPTKILAWNPTFKGIDDALIADVPLKSLEVEEWLRLLTPECLDEARHQLEGILPQKISG